jgi:molecular chaperone DnaK
MDIGIDLGTTFSVIAVNGKVDLVPDYPAGIYLDECDVTIIPTPYGEQTFPSVMFEDPESPGAYSFGSDALAKLEEGHAPVMFSKRKIGTKEPIPFGAASAVAKDVAREFLRYLKQCAERALGCAVSRGVITHPAYFDRAAVEETRQAAIEAGFDMSLTEQMLMEPVAAALAYARTDHRDPLHILTYDLGGGTFDVTCLVRRSGLIDMRAFDGDHLMGGYNFDRELVGWVRKCLEAKKRRIVLDESDPEDRARLARLLRLAEQVKIALANAPADDAKVEFRGRGVLVDVDGKDVQINERISRAEFVALIAPYLRQAIDCCRRALQKAGMEPSEIDEVLLVGGSTYGPWVAASVREAFPQLAPKMFSPDLCVGAGAAIHAKMVLPVLVGKAGCRLVLDVPEVSVLETINVAGRVTAADGRLLTEPPAVSLRLPGLETLGPIPVAADGRFLFEEVALTADETNRFVLFVSGRADQTLLEHEFQVRHAVESGETSGVSTVLPKPLYIETLDGLVPLAKEGVALPAQCEQTFTRENDNLSISLKLFQDRHSVGEVRIENIPPEGGRGSLVLCHS